jgi:hypothetical protein
MKTYVLCLVLAVVVLASTLTPAAADKVMINTYGVTPFIYGGYSYVPLRSAADFLGAALLWDGLRNRATVVYRGHELGLVVGSNVGYYRGRQVALPVPPILVGDQLLVPATVFDRYFEVPVRWDDADDEVGILGPPGWGYYRVRPHPPGHAVTVIEGYGSPVYPGLYAPAPFIYSGVTYLPLRNVAEIIGAALLWDNLQNRAVLVFGGRELALAIGSPTVYYGRQVIVLPAAPIIINNVVYVPEPLFARHLRVPIERGRGVIRIKGSKGWKDMRLVSAPPSRVIAAGRRGGPQARPPAQRGPRMRGEQRAAPAPRGRGAGRESPRMKQAGPPERPGAAAIGGKERGKGRPERGHGGGKGKG